MALKISTDFHIIYTGQSHGVCPIFSKSTIQCIHWEFDNFYAYFQLSLLSSGVYM